MFRVLRLYGPWLWALGLLPVRSPLLRPVVAVVGPVLLPALVGVPTPVVPGSLVPVPDRGARPPAGALSPSRIPWV